MNFHANDSRFMARALQLARNGWFTTRSNPRVGCVLVKQISSDDNGSSLIIGQGWHQVPGQAHAEVNAILDAHRLGHDTRGATAYVTLEPCSHFGKTPPCSQALIKAGVKKVICAMKDPNSQVAGRGIQMLREAGIEVDYGLMQEEAEALNAGFIKRMLKGLPRVVAKMAVSVDGRTAMASGESQWITGEQARAEVQSLRAQSGAVITGSGTVLYDNPSMNVRAESFINNEYFEQPLRVIIDSKQRVSPDANIFKPNGRCWLVCADSTTEQFPENVESRVIETDGGFIKLESLLRQLAVEGVNDVLVEAGSDLLGAFLQQGLVDELQIFMAPKLLGSAAKPMAKLPFDAMRQAINLKLQDVRQIGQDLKFIYTVE